MAQETCGHCGADLTVPGAVTFRTRDCSAGGWDVVAGSLRGTGSFAADGLHGTLDAGVVGIPVTSWCSRCRGVLPDAIANVTVR